ncbi:hypothetical protein AVEN_17577-1 [Araneus ventricosus]|uniref:Uncharacterized protein n=1 Tax=Araneus ventricosus TaxID=182803 RepID=A0A4Y2IYI1_ARAVE|nr:hypothetical protein AVEN_17577-1 [Araneus ventricosus]
MDRKRHTSTRPPTSEFFFLQSKPTFPPKWVTDWNSDSCKIETDLSGSGSFLAIRETIQQLRRKVGKSRCASMNIPALLGKKEANRTKKKVVSPCLHGPPRLKSRDFEEDVIDTHRDIELNVARIDKYPNNLEATVLY